MTSSFVRQLEPCARNGRLVRPPPPVAKRNSAPPIPRPICDKSYPDRIPEHKTQAAFLQALIAYEDGEASHELQEKLAKAERDRKSIRRAMLFMVTLFILSLAGLSYCALLVPEVFSNSTPFLTKSLIILGLASLISQLEFFGYLLWHRGAVNRLHKECRHRALLLVQSRLKASFHRSLTGASGQEPGPTLASASAEQTGILSPEPLL